MHAKKLELQVINSLSIPNVCIFVTKARRLTCDAFFFFRIIGHSIERLCEIMANEPLEHDDALCDRTAMVRAARTLLNSVTRVLLLADIVVVKQLLLAKDKVHLITKHS